MKFAILPDSSVWRLGGHKIILQAPQAKLLLPMLLLAALADRLSAFMEHWCPLDKALSFTKRFSNSTTFVK